MKGLLLSNNFDLEEFKINDTFLTNMLTKEIIDDARKRTKWIYEEKNVSFLDIYIPSVVNCFKSNSEKRGAIARCVLLYNFLSNLIFYNTPEVIEYISLKFRLTDDQTKWFINLNQIIDILNEAENKGYYFPTSQILILSDIHLKSKFINSLTEQLFPKSLYNRRTTNPIGKELIKLTRNITYRKGKGIKINKTQEEKELMEIIESFNSNFVSAAANLFIIKKPKFSYSDFILGKTEKTLIKPFFREIPYITDKVNYNKKEVNKIKFSLLRLLTQDYTFKDEDSFSECVLYQSSFSYNAYISKKLNSYLKL